MKETKIDVENVVLHLFKAYPNVKYIALNTALTISNQSSWKDHWYFIGFLDKPVYKILDGYPTWVASKKVRSSSQEWGMFFLHVSSKNHEFRGVPIQKSQNDFASPRHFCWKLNDDGETMTQLVSEEVKPSRKRDDEMIENFKDMITSTLLDPVVTALKPSDEE